MLEKAIAYILGTSFRSGPDKAQLHCTPLYKQRAPTVKCAFMVRDFEIKWEFMHTQVEAAGLSQYNSPACFFDGLLVIDRSFGVVAVGVSVESDHKTPSSL